MPETPRDPRIPDLISAAEAAKVLGISRQAVVDRAAKGALLGAKVGSTWVFRRSVVHGRPDRDSPHPARSAALNDGGE